VLFRSVCKSHGSTKRVQHAVALMYRLPNVSNLSNTLEILATAWVQHKSTETSFFTDSIKSNKSAIVLVRNALKLGNDLHKLNTVLQAHVVLRLSPT
jgi:hypothetical protein